MTEFFQFDADGRTYRCHVAAVSRSVAEPWWWFDVSGDANHYAPFRAESGDTRESVRQRIIEYYTNHLAHRSGAFAAASPWARRDRRPRPAS